MSWDHKTPIRRVSSVLKECGYEHSQAKRGLLWGTSPCLLPGGCASLHGCSSYYATLTKSKTVGTRSPNGITTETDLIKTNP
jgi:hypothetical protein